MRELDVEGVYQFALKHKLDEEDAGILKKQEIDGSDLLETTKEELVKLYGMPGGAATKLLQAVKAQQPSKWCLGGIGWHWVAKSLVGWKNGFCTMPRYLCTCLTCLAC